MLLFALQSKPTIRRSSTVVSTTSVPTPKILAVSGRTTVGIGNASVSFGRWFAADIDFLDNRIITNAVRILAIGILGTQVSVVTVATSQEMAVLIRPTLGVLRASLELTTAQMRCRQCG